MNYLLWVEMLSFEISMDENFSICSLLSILFSLYFCFSLF